MKKVLSVILCLAVILAAGCGSKPAIPTVYTCSHDDCNESVYKRALCEKHYKEYIKNKEEKNHQVDPTRMITPTPTDTPLPTETPTPTPTVPISPLERPQGQVLNIYASNIVFLDMLEKYYPGFQRLDDFSGTVGDYIINFTFIEADLDDYVYESLVESEHLAPDSRIDMFITYTSLYDFINSQYTMDLGELGLTYDMADNLFMYSIERNKDINNAVKAVNWEISPYGIIYNRAMAKEILGTDDPEEVQLFVSTWDNFLSTAELAKQYGYLMCRSVDDLYPFFAAGKTSPWVYENELLLDSTIADWASFAYYMVQNGYSTDFDTWSDYWYEGVYPEGNTFCYLGPSWMYDYALHEWDEASIASQGGWGFVAAPYSYVGSDSSVFVAENTDNAQLIMDILYYLTIDAGIAEELLFEYGNPVSNTHVMNYYASDPDIYDAVLRDENPLPYMVQIINNAPVTPATSYDYTLDSLFTASMELYLEGFSTFEDAVAEFYKSALAIYPDLH